MPNIYYYIRVITHITFSSSFSISSSQYLFDLIFVRYYPSLTTPLYRKYLLLKSEIWKDKPNRSAFQCFTIIIFVLHLTENTINEKTTTL